jgi:hypothetical protein
VNERIQELIKQAGDYVNEVYTPPVRSKTPDKIWEDGHIAWTTLFNEKLAELIVQECLEACSRANEIRHFVPPTQEQVVLSCMREIEQHFGIKEYKREQIDKAMREAFKNGVDLSGRNTP